jgi:uncharacterized RDD family membrane protein YckC/Tfp pilus assembly major pilin PilA
MAFCQSCGVQFADGSAFCPSCGSRIIQPVTPDAWQDLPTTPSPLPPLPTPMVSRPPLIVQAGFFRRWLALIVDGLILGIPIAIVAIVLGMAGAGDTDEGTTGSMIQGVYYLLYWLVAPFYYALQESSSAQATLGKRALGIKVTDLKGRRISFGHAIGRWFAAMLSYLTFYIGFLMAAFTEKKQALHDMVAGTLVVDKYAYTEQPQLQKEELNGCLIAVVVAIFLFIPITAILAAIALPAYNNYRVRSAEAACQAEAKAYMNSAVAAGMSQQPIAHPPSFACASPGTALTPSDIASAAVITFTPRPPGSAVTACDASTAICSMTPSH